MLYQKKQKKNQTYAAEAAAAAAAAASHVELVSQLKLPKNPSGSLIKLKRLSMKAVASSSSVDNY